MRLANRRRLNFAGFLACVAMMGFALFSQYVLLLDPCPLCIFQRLAVIMLGLVLLVAAIPLGHAGVRLRRAGTRTSEAIGQRRSGA